MKGIILLIFLTILMIFPVLTCAYSDEPKVIFHDDICIIPHFKYHFLTCHPITVTIDNFILVIPEHFDTDLASIPRIFWSIISPNNSSLIGPAILHDYLYTCNNGYTRKESDNIFYVALLNNGTNTITAYSLYIAVRFFGENFYKASNCYKNLMVNSEKYNKEINI